jgi:hypothetical protein
MEIPSASPCYITVVRRLVVSSLYFVMLGLDPSIQGQVVKRSSDTAGLPGQAGQ